MNVYWAMAGKMANLFSSLVVGIIIARYLGPEQFGLMNYVVSFVFLFQILSTFGMDNIEIREEAKGEVNINKIIGTSFTIRIVIGILCIILCIATSLILESDIYVTSLIAIYSLSIVINSAIVARNYFYALVQNKRVVQTEIVRTLICIVIKLILLYLRASLTWFIVTSLLDVLIVSVGYCTIYHKIIGSIFKWQFDKSYARFLIKESFPLMLTSAAVITYQRIDQVMIGQLIDKESVGYFSVASRFTEILIYIPIVLSQTISPILTKAKHENTTYEEKSQRFMNISTWCSLIAAIIMSICSYWVILLLFGETYLPAVPILQLMSFKVVSVAISNTAGTLLVIEGLQRYAIFRDAFGCVVCVILNALLLPSFGVIAAAGVAIASNLAAGYLADAIIPAYRHLFHKQTKALFIGWRDIHYAFTFASKKNI